MRDKRKSQSRRLIPVNRKPLPTPGNRAAAPRCPPWGGGHAGSTKTYRATVTVQCARAQTSAATDPSISRENPRLSPVPITM